MTAATPAAAAMYDWWSRLWDADVLGLTMLGRDRRYQAVNPTFCHLMETSASELCSWSYERIGHPLDLDVELDAFSQLDAGARSVTYRRRYRPARTQEFHAHVQLLSGEQDTVLQLIHLLPMPESASVPAAERRLQALAAALSHDAREPLRQLSVAVGRLAHHLERVLNDDERAVIRHAEHLAVKLGQRLRALGRFARLGAPMIPTIPWPLHVLVQNAFAQVPLPPQVSSCNRVPSDVMVRADQAQFTIAVVELLRNAVQFQTTTRPAQITVRAQQDGIRLVLEVIDHGEGIAADIRPRLGRLFATAAPATASGDGVGLAIARAITEAHGGTLELHATDGGGTTVRLVLPFAPPAVNAMDPPAAGSALA